MSIETIPYRNVVEANKDRVDGIIEAVLDPKVRASATVAMANLWAEKKTQKYFRDIAKLVEGSPWKDSGFGVYFATVANLKSTYGPRVLPKVNREFGTNWRNPVELGSGVGTIEPARGLIELLQGGIANPDLVTQYDSPGGTYPSRWAGATIINSKFGGDYPVLNPVYEFRDTYITPSSTYAIDVAFEAFARQTEQEQSGQSRVVIPGPSYYVLALAAVDKGLPVTRLLSPKNQKEEIMTFLPTAEELRAQMPEDTGMMVLTLPNNPNGEIYQEVQLTRICELARERNILVLLDLVFDPLFYQDKTPQSSILPAPLSVAQETGILDQVVIVDGLSKSLNLAGERVGILATKNGQLERLINKISISRLSNPSLTVEPLLQFEAMARFLDTKADPNSSSQEVSLAVELARRDLEKATGNQWLSGTPDYKLSEWYKGRQNWLNQAMRYYQDNLTIIKTVLDCNGRRTYRSPDQAAYNTLIGFGETTKNIGFDKILKLFLLTGIISMSGQCFGIQDQGGEFWTRITYGGLSRERLVEAVNRLLSFLDLWDEMDLGNPQRFPVYDENFKVI